MEEERGTVVCSTPTPGKGTRRIRARKYAVVRSAILDVLGRHPEGVAFRDLAGLVQERLGTEESARLGSVPWYTATVKLDLEVRGEVERVQGVSPQRLRRPEPG